MKRIFTIFLTLFVASSVWAQTYINPFYYELNSSDKTAKVVGGTLYSGDLTIPSTVQYKGTVYDVTDIGYEAFKGCTKLKSITIPQSVTVIGRYTFEGCTGLKSITMPKSLTRIYYGAFSGCSSLTSIKIPKDVTYLEYPFQGCTNLTSLSVDDNNKNYVAKNNCIIKSNKLVAGCKGSTIPNTVTKIGDSAFEDCTGLTSITIPNSVTYIDDRAFKGCTGLKSITIPESVEYIDDNAFEGCTNLTSITIPDGVKYIGLYAFSGCTSLTSIKIPEGVSSIGRMAFNGCTKLASVTIPEGVTSIGEEAFYNCTSLKSITIPESVISIGKSAFSGCTNLRTIAIPKNVVSIETRTFKGCTNLDSVTIPEGVTSIGEEAFQQCESLTSVTIPESVSSIGEEAFLGCTAISSIKISEGNSIYDSRNNCNAIIETATNTLVLGCKNTTIPESVTSIGESAFDGCIGLTSITIPKSVSSIGRMAFHGCTKLASVTIPEGVTSIGEEAFYNCTCLKSITIPNTVTKIGDSVFEDCTGLTSITIPNSVTYIDGKAFKGCTGLKSITIPDGVKCIGLYAFEDCTGLKSITMPKSLTRIEPNAFEGCTNLTSVICMATTPPGYNDSNFNLVLLYVPCESIDLYRNHRYWGKINSIECISCNISLSTNDNAQGSVEGDGEFLLGETVTITAKPASGYKFEQWNDGNTENPRTITVNSDVNYTAIFVEIPVYSVELDVNNASYGSVKGDGEFEEGATTSISATAYSGYRFTQWNDGNTENPRKLTVNTDMSFTAMFEEIPVYAIFVAANDASYGSVEGGGEYREGVTASISAMAYSGYKFTQWNDGNTANPRNVTISADQNYTAIFEKLPNPTAVSEVSNATAVTIVNGQILVNGEAPAFVVTVSGQKIANANLKSGVYFVVADGKTVGISVR